jgi:predicted dehydrogenase
VGVGWAGTQHVGCFVKNPQCRIVGLCGRSPDRVRANLAGAGISLPDAYVTDDFGRLVDDPDIQLIAIATPNDRHAAEAVAAAMAGKHLLIEKPVG